MHEAGEEYDSNMGWWKFLNLPVHESWQTAMVFVTTVSDRTCFAHTSAPSSDRGRPNYHNTKLTESLSSLA